MFAIGKLSLFLEMFPQFLQGNLAVCLNRLSFDEVRLASPIVLDAIYSYVKETLLSIK